VDRSRPPGALELDSCDAGENIDPARGQTDLDHAFGTQEVLFRYTERFQWSAEPLESHPHSLGIVGNRLDPYIEITRGAGHPMDRHSVSADDEESCAGLQESSQHVAEILVQVVVFALEEGARSILLTGASALE